MAIYYSLDKKLEIKVFLYLQYFSKYIINRYIIATLAVWW